MNERACQACGGDVDLESFPGYCNRIACRRYAQAKLMREQMPMRSPVSDKKVEERPILTDARPLAPTEVDPREFGARWEPSLVGFNDPCISYGETRTLVSEPYVRFRPQRLVIAPYALDSFNLVDFKIGMNSQLPNADQIMASAFPPIPANVPMHQLGDWIKAQTIHCDICEIGMKMKLTLVNCSGSACRFQAVLWGEAVFP